ncbi:MAG TPA: ATP-dependent Clp protease adapter ClpS [Bdellovibrionales bacterium]|nr:MAG: ATP-dependent Clp protease adaptor ClpS [Bdellovibrionales bacterium GWB1_52_6]OFZ03161.1 MAG: ATP-dependent Clp protease adaptor ClpS [Bdellovibrionales bacterium GWA1_52_35]HAR43508.1 ATP-dependent Clp protease adapter ClpS [Bdellovibrionales bacterium]HCM38346.1 ATP-dependent Clp protease adapter ClpS [Bdellovibrionales bacterium]
MSHYRPGQIIYASTKTTQPERSVAVEEGRPKLSHPPKFAVLLLNDDYTTMEFVVEVLKRFFGKKEEDAMQVMLSVHHSGKGLAGIYSRDIAETKASQVQEYARGHGFPLLCTVEPVV